MPSCSCAVAVCNNNFNWAKKEGKKLAFFTFPKEPKLRKRWIDACHRIDNFDPDTTRICSDHFKNEDFIRDLRAELMGDPKRKTLLKTGTVPSLKLLPRPENSCFSDLPSTSTARSKKIEIRQQKEVVEQLIIENLENSDITEGETAVQKYTTPEEKSEKLKQLDDSAVKVESVEEQKVSDEVRTMSEPLGRVIKLQDRETVKFLHLYAGERLLYDPSCKEYKDRDLRAEAAKRISEAMGIPGFGAKEVISKFKNLRSSYCQELKKIADSERLGADADDVYIPKVFWFHIMDSFIRPFIQQRSTPNLEMRTNSSSPGSFGEVSQETAFDDISLVMTCHLETDAPAETLKIAQTAPESTETPKSTIKRKAPSETSLTKIAKTTHDPQSCYGQSKIEKLDEFSNFDAQFPREDSYDHFGKYVASMLRSIGPPTALRLEEKITALITRAMCPPSPSMDS